MAMGECLITVLSSIQMIATKVFGASVSAEMWRLIAARGRTLVANLCSSAEKGGW